jgi:hypothetical protein
VEKQSEEKRWNRHRQCHQPRAETQAQIRNSYGCREIRTISLGGFRYLFPLFFSHVLRVLVHAHSHKLAVPKMAVRGPFDELELPHELRL